MTFKYYFGNSRLVLMQLRVLYLRCHCKALNFGQPFVMKKLTWISKLRRLLLCNCFHVSKRGKYWLCVNTFNYNLSMFRLHKWVSPQNEAVKSMPRAHCSILCLYFWKLCQNRYSIHMITNFNIWPVWATCTEL